MPLVDSKQLANAFDGVAVPSRLIHPLTRRGFFSEYSVLLWTLLFCDIQEIELRVAVTEHSMIPAHVAYRLLNVRFLPPLSSRLFMLSERTRRLWTRHVYAGSTKPFSWANLWNREYELWLSSRIDTVAALNVLHTKIWRWNETDQASVPEPRPYVAMHVRRGDKLKREASYVGPATFFDMIPQSALGTKVVVVTDDYRAFLEFKEFVAAQKLDVEITTTARATDSGYDNPTFKKQSPAERADAIKKLLSDFDVLCKSTFLVCSYSSNVGRMAHIVRGGHNIASVDTNFAFVQ